MASATSSAAAHTAQTVPTHRDREGRHAQDHPEDNGRRDKRKVPVDMAGQFERPHAEIVHDGDAAADDGSANGRAPASWRQHRDRQSNSRDGARGEQRHDRQIDVIGDRHSGLVGEHRQEMRRPDAAPGRGSRRREPDRAGATLGRTRAMEQCDCGQARQKADNAGDRDQAPVMLRREAVEDSKQPYPSLGCAHSARCLANIVLRFLNKHSALYPYRLSRRTRLALTMSTPPTER
jgi:hypothetical protein